MYDGWWNYSKNHIEWRSPCSWFATGSKLGNLRERKSLANEWKKQFKFKKNSLRVAVTDVIRLTKNSTTVDLNFKKNFVSVLISFLIQAPSNFYIRKKLLGFCCDLDNCSNYNWCELVLRSLKNSGKFWSNDAETRYYTGSLPFILVCFPFIKWHESHLNNMLTTLNNSSTSFWTFTLDGDFFQMKYFQDLSPGIVIVWRW